jgi:hypothetical protein
VVVEGGRVDLLALHMVPSYSRRDGQTGTG